MNNPIYSLLRDVNFLPLYEEECLVVYLIGGEENFRAPVVFDLAKKAWVDEWGLILDVIKYLPLDK